ncbi:marine proteobacterial sortase target protein [Halopseudomonas sabulinigri]|uniref:Marine proteobacterial sortase target protein n=1 Tax=Halopseudomonas sabulinigri TaxID=472181 RepID=A0ABP9ZP33_9GAMM
MKYLIGWIMLISSLLAQAAWANEPGEPGTGQFLLRHDASASWQPALLLNTEMDVQISGPIAEVRIRQTFSNPGGAFAEGQYVLPVSEQAAVHAMTLDIGERRIEGAIHEREQARKIYQQAKDAGQRSGLVEQSRPNLFRTSVANIGAGEVISVTLSYTELLAPDATRFSLRLPLTMTPRYVPGPAPSDNPQQPAAPRPAGPEGPITTSLGDNTDSHQAQINLYLDSGMELAQVRSPSHAIDTRYDGHGYAIALRQNPVPMDRDFVLDWQLPAEAGNQAALFSEAVGEGYYALLMLSPAASNNNQQRQPREVFLILDTSGSMQGERIRQARSSVVYALSRLQPEDRFNVLEFNSEYSMLFREPQQANAANLHEARRWVQGLPASGGTEMLPVLREALTQPNEPGYLRQLIFITDGSVSNERDVLQMIHQRLRQARVFTVGIGAAPNNYLLRKAAEVGRGQFTAINDADGVGESMNRLFEKLESPVLTQLALQLPPGIEAETWPQKLPDLYAGQPLVVAMKLNRLPEEITLSGQQPEPWQLRLMLPEQQNSKGVARLWAQRKIDAMMDKLNAGAGDDEVRDLVLPVALEHQLMSKYTSFVALEPVPARAVEEPLHSQQIPNLNPVDHRAYPQTSLGLAGLWSLALTLLLAAMLVLFWRQPASGSRRHA